MNGKHIAIMTLLVCGCREAPDSGSPDDSVPQPSAAVEAVMPSDSLASAICLGLANSYQCAQAIERSLLEAPNPTVLRNGRVLRIALDGGDSLVLTDSLAGDVSGVRHSYRGLLPAVGYHVIEKQYYEGSQYLLANARTGWTAHSNGLPVLSPDSARLAAGNVDLEAEYSPTTLQIWSVGGDTLAIELEHDFLKSATRPDSVWGPGSIVWQSPSELLVTRQFSLGAVSGTARVVRDGMVWRIQSP